MNSLNIFKYDLISFFTYTLLVTFGIVNIYSATYNESFTTVIDYTSIVGKQLIFLLACIVAFFLIIFTKKKFLILFRRFYISFQLYYYLAYSYLDLKEVVLSLGM